MATKRHRLAQRRKTVGFTQEMLAEQLSVDSTTVRRWETGETETGPQPWIRPKLARCLQVSLEQLEELLSEATPADTASRAPEVDEQHVAAALADARRYFDGPVVDYFRHQLDTCMTGDGEVGPTQTLPKTLGLLRAIEHYGREVQPAIRRELLSLGACAAEFVGWLYRDANDLVQAGFWYDRATEWAQEARDFPMQGYVLLKKSQMAYDERDAVRVLTFAQAAQYGPWQLPGAVRAEVTQQEARGLAMIGEPISIIEQKLDDASRLLTDAPFDDGPCQLGGSFNEGTLALRAASCYLEAGKPQQAAALYAQVLAGDGLSRRDRGYFLARRASSLVLAGEPDEAAGTGLEATQLASMTTSQRTKQELLRVLEALKPWRNRPGPRDLREALLTFEATVTNPS